MVWLSLPSEIITKTIKRIVSFSLALAIIFAALIILRRHTENITSSTLVNAVKGVPPIDIILSLVATFVSFAAMGVNEIIAVNALPNKRLLWHTPVLAGTIGNALSNTLGLHALTISAWRYKLYSAVGLNLRDITRISSVAFIGVVLGFAGVAAFSLLLIDKNVHVLAPMLLLFFIAGFQLWIGRKPRPINFKGWSLFLPDRKYGVLQLIVGMLDLSAAIYAAYVLLPTDIAPSFAQFAIFYISAVLFGIASQAPGGIGIFEAAMLAALGAVGRADILAELLLYRILYNLIPFGLACLMIVTLTLLTRGQLDNG